MPTYISLLKWTDQGRRDVATLPQRVDEVTKKLGDLGVKTIGIWSTMGQYDQIAVFEAPDEDTIAKVSAMVAARGNAITETLRAWSMDEVRSLMG